MKEPRPLGEFACLKCQGEWKNYPGPQDCPKCGSKYVRWVNFEEFDWLKGVPTGGSDQQP